MEHANDPTSSQAETDAAVKTRSDRIEKFLSEYLSESMLWPVFIAVGAHVWVVLSAVLLFVVRDHNPLALVPAFIFGVGSVMVVRGSVLSKHKVIPALVIISWLIAAVLAVIVNRYDVY